MDRIAHMNKVERRRLGMLLSQADCLPEWRVVQARSLKPVVARLTGDERRLYNFLLPLESKHRDTHVIRHLWPHCIEPGEHLDRNHTLRARLRKLKERANKSLALFDPGYEICYVKPGGRALYIHLDGRNAVEELEDRLRAVGKWL
jgi:hypothetical protein